MTILVTTYQNPDLDGVACSVAYAALLRAQGKDAQAGIFGTLDCEAQFVLDEIDVKAPEDAEKLVGRCSAIVLTDTTELLTIASSVHLEKVVEIIDHRAFHNATQFPQAAIQIELVGAAATLVVERYRAAHIVPSKSSAILLYCAIASHTINFRASVTTARDHDAAQYVQKIADVDDNFVYEMFRAKSRFTDDADFVQHLKNELAIFEIAGETIGIAQLEVMDARDVVRAYKAVIADVLGRGFAGNNKYKKNLDYIFLTAIDIKKGENIFFTKHVPSQKLLEELLAVSFDDNSIALYPHIIMRKEITPQIKALLEKGNGTIKI